jgi:hypothetical protein
MVLLFLLIVAAAAYAGIAGADPVWVLGTVASLALAGWLLVGVLEVTRTRKREARERPSAYPGQVLVARFAVWWLACRLARTPAVVAAMARRPHVLPDRSPATWGRSVPSRHRRHQ